MPKENAAYAPFHPQKLWT